METTYIGTSRYVVTPGPICSLIGEIFLYHQNSKKVFSEILDWVLQPTKRHGDVHVAYENNFFERIK
jgi:hypothetical protein